MKKLFVRLFVLTALCGAYAVTSAQSTSIISKGCPANPCPSGKYCCMNDSGFGTCIPNNMRCAYP